MGIHPDCMGLAGPRPGPFYCSACKDRYRKEGRRDVTLDEEAMSYLYRGVTPEDPDVRTRCRKIAGWLKVNEWGELMVHEPDGRQRETPTIGRRPGILERLH